MSFQGRRKEDSPKTKVWSRTDRMFEQGGSWHFYTREGTIEGPFASRHQATDRLEVYVNLMKAGMSPGANDGPDLSLEPM